MITPNGDEISFGNSFDEVSGGRLEGDASSSTVGPKTENIYFPGTFEAGAEFVFEVRLFASRGPSLDEWTVSVVQFGVLVVEETGTGDSFAFIFNSIGAPTASPTITQQPSPAFVTACSLSTSQCCTSVDCSLDVLGDLCVGELCYYESAVRVTLSFVAPGMIREKLRCSIALTHLGVPS